MNSTPNIQAGGYTVPQLPAKNPNLRHINVGGKLFTYHMQTIDKLDGVSGAYFKKLFDTQYNASLENRPEPYIEVSPSIFEKWIDPFIRLGCLPDLDTVQDAQELSTIQASINMLGLDSVGGFLKYQTKNIFGPELWDTHLGDIYWEEIPKAPSEWEQIKNKPSPFFRNRTIGQTETLVFRPASINEVDATLPRLQYAFKHLRKGDPMEISIYSSCLKKLEDTLYDGKAYWFTMTNEGINPEYKKKDIFAKNPEYSLPKCVEATMFIYARHLLGKVPEQAFFQGILCKDGLDNPDSEIRIVTKIQDSEPKKIIIESNNTRYEQKNYVIVPCRRFL
jgi:hypothetical protein